MYPLLKSLVKEGLAKVTKESGRGVSKTYALTPKGKQNLDEARQIIAGAGKKEPVMSRLFAELLPGEIFIPMIVRRFRDGADVFREKVDEIPKEARIPILREFRLVLGSQLEWIDSQLADQGF